MGEFNAGYDFSDSVQLYAFGTYGHKFAKSFENDRLPNQVIATIGSNQPCSATNPNGYNTGSSTANGLTPACTGLSPIAGSSSNPGPTGGPGTPGGGHHLQGRGRIICASAGNLFSNTLINAHDRRAVCRRHRCGRA